MLGDFTKRNKTSGVTLIEILIGTALFLIIFIGIFGLIQTGMKVIGQSKARTVATALANQKIELVRNLAYNQVGTIGGIPPGSIIESETLLRNNASFTIKTTVIYIDDPFDNSFPNDPLAWDYKRVKVKVSWSGFLGGEVSLQTDVTPKGIETTGGGGIISILVFNASGQAIPRAEIHIENSAVVPEINAYYQTDNQGYLFVPGAPACNDCYKIIATKTEYSSERTYAVGEQIRGIVLSAPNKPYLSVLEGQLSEISFAIDHAAIKTVQTIAYTEEKSWNDSFADETKISGKFQVTVNLASSSVELEEQEGQYQSSGYLYSITITPSGLVEWGRLNWNNEIPVSTGIKYQILYFNGEDWVLIPDQDLTVDNIPNSEGFSSSPIDLSELSTIKYSSVRLKANFSTASPAQTPVLNDWQITWFSSETSTPVANLAFTMQGAKILGNDANGQPIYKFQESFSTDSNGQIIIPNLEWDSYKITVNGPATGYDLANSSLPQPVNIDPDADQIVALKLASHQTHNLLVTVKNSGGESLIAANVRLYKTGYDKTKLTTNSGQSFFSPLTQATYNLEVKITGYADYLNQINVSGQTEQAVIMTPP